MKGKEEQKTNLSSTTKTASVRLKVFEQPLNFDICVDCCFRDFPSVCLSCGVYVDDLGRPHDTPGAAPRLGIKRQMYLTCGGNGKTLCTNHRSMETQSRT